MDSLRREVSSSSSPSRSVLVLPTSPPSLELMKTVFWKFYHGDSSGFVAAHQPWFLQPQTPQACPSISLGLGPTMEKEMEPGKNYGCSCMMCGNGSPVGLHGPSCFISHFLWDRPHSWQQQNCTGTWFSGVCSNNGRTDLPPQDCGSHRSKIASTNLHCSCWSP